VLSELALLYESFRKGQPDVPELPMQFADFAAWQRDWLTGRVLSNQLGWWKERLRDVPAAGGLPTDRPRPPARTYRGSTRHTVVDRPLLADLKALGRREDVTLFMTFLAAFKALLLRYTGQEDCVVGTPVANRTRLETESLIRMFANALPCVPTPEIHVSGCSRAYGRRQWTPGLIRTCPSTIWWTN
jgi:hypothetical protein